MGECDLVELGADEGLDGVWSQLLHQDRIGDAVFDVFVDGERKAAQKLRLGDEDKAVVFGEVLEEQADLAQR